jgi:hypothetical protein
MTAIPSVRGRRDMKLVESLIDVLKKEAGAISKRMGYNGCREDGC